jgi:phage head maturation protease
MVKSELLTEGSFAFTISDETEEIINGKAHRTIKGVGKLFDVSICDNGAYGDLTEIYARSRELVETKCAELENSKKVRANIQRLRNKNKLLIGGKK